MRPGTAKSTAPPATGVGAPAPDTPACLPSLEVVVGDPIRLWGQGHTSTGLPANVPEGAAAVFTGGSTSDRWLNHRVRPYALGAVGRTDLTVFCGVEARVRVAQVNLTLTNGPASLPATAWIGNKRHGRVRLRPDLGGIEPTGPCGEHMWLYVLAKRQGLVDAAGTYAGTVVVEIMPD